MGDIATHAAIAEDIIAVFRQAWPHEENYAFFELGNWLTDVSQFRDPYAMISAKMRMWNEARGAVVASGQCVDPIMGWIDLSPRTCLESDRMRFDDFAVAMMGAPGTDGALTMFFRDLIFVFGCEKFRRSPSRILPREFAEVYSGRPGQAGHFTQYYPHEHLDFPPWPHGVPWGNRGAREDNIA